MSKASNYREDLMFDKDAEAPSLVLRNRTEDHYTAKITEYGVVIPGWAFLSQDDALKLRDWLTEVFE